MPKYRAEDEDAQEVENALHKEGLRHLRARRRADLVTIESGPNDDPVRHARLRRVTVHLWRLEMATHTNRWEPTPVRDLLENVLRTLLDDFGWTLAPVGEYPERTSDRDY